VAVALIAVVEAGMIVLARIRGPVKAGMIVPVRTGGPG